MLNLHLRQLQPELMDDPALDSADHAQALRGLARVHRLTGTTARFWQHIKRSTRPAAGRLVIMDVGCGDGLMLRQLYRIAQREGVELELHACDFSERALEMARSAAKSEQIPIITHHVDIIESELTVGADIVICSLFLHHFKEATVVRILEKLSKSSRQVLLIEDLLRSKLGLILCWIGVYSLTRSRIVHVDGPLSVRAAFTQKEICDLAQQAGLHRARVRKHWPERFLLEWSPEENEQ